MGWQEDIDRDCGAAGQVTPGRTIMAGDFNIGLDTPGCHVDAIDVIGAETDADGMTTLHGACGHSLTITSSFPVTDYTAAIADFFGTAVMSERQRLADDDVDGA